MDDMDSMTVSEARGDFAEVVNRVHYGHERVVITRRGKAVAALVSADDLELLEDLEEARDLADVRGALAEDDGERIPWRAVKARLGLGSTPRVG